ncbi:MAG: flagellar basal body protein, partial [Microvirgula sp.]
MIEALYIGSTGMAAQQTGLETIANNLANMNTPTFKRARVTFSDLVHRDRDLSRPGGAGGYIGSGTRVGTIDTVF